MQMLRLVPGQLKVGAPLPFNVRDEQGQLLLARGHVLASEPQLQALLARGLYAGAEEVRALRNTRSDVPPDTRKRTLFDLWEEAIWRLDRLLKSLVEEAEFPRRCDEFAQQLMLLVQRDVDIAIYLTLRQDERRLNLYGLTHALHVAVVCQLLGLRMGRDDATTRRLVKAALTMNLSIVELQGRFAALGRLTEGQREQLRQHPAQAAQALRAAGVDDEPWLQAVLEHHEHPDGQGYPQGLNQVGELAWELRMADVFMAKISARASRPPMPVQEAARQMFKESGGSQAAASIIKEYGLYPPGDFVQLASGERAVVIRRGATAMTPLAAAITDKAGLPMVDTVRRDTSLKAFAITGPVSDRSLVVRVPPERLFGLAA